jgi:hypothetical protein
MVAKRLSMFLLLLLVLTGCTVVHSAEVQKIALLAPFEGRYREIGYDALYAARLAISESGIQNIDLLAIDDGASVETAVMRANAIRQDSAIKAVITLGLYASDASVQAALGDTPMLIVGHWGAEVSSPNVYMLSSPEITNLISWNGEVTAIPEGDIRGSEILALYQVPMLREDTSRLTIYSSGSLPDEDFRQRFLNSALYVPEPNLLATLSYDATVMLLEAISSNTSISEISYEGINGRISFENGYWKDAPIHVYGYEDNHLLERPSMTP